MKQNTWSQKRPSEVKNVFRGGAGRLAGLGTPDSWNTHQISSRTTFSVPFHFARTSGSFNIPRAISTFIAGLVTEMPPGKAARWLLSNCEQGSRLLTRRRFVPSSQRDHPKKPSPWSIPSPSQQLTLDAHTHLNGLSWNHNSHKAVETAGYRGLWAKRPKFKSWFCLLQAMPKTLYFSVPQFALICMMEESQGLIGQLNSCLTVLSTRRRDDTIPQSQTNLKWAHFLE